MASRKRKKRDVVSLPSYIRKRLKWERKARRLERMLRAFRQKSCMRAQRLQAEWDETRFPAPVSHWRARVARFLESVDIDAEESF